MITTAEFMNTDAALEPVRMTNGGPMMVRGVQRLTGAALAVAAIGLWIAPGASWESDIMLFKLVLSVVALLAGVGLMQASAPPNTPEVEIDTIRREIRLLRPASEGARSVIARYAFSKLSHAERLGHQVRVWGNGGTLLAEVTLKDRTAMDSLIAGLRDAGKID